MGLFNGSLGNYYSGDNGFGGYQFISLKDAMNNFRVAYVGEDKIISKISRADIKFHAMRGIQELSYDTLRSCKTLELEVPPSLLLPLPHDYVEYVKITWMDSEGKCHTILNCKACPKDPLSYKQKQDGTIDLTKTLTEVEITEGELVWVPITASNTFNPCENGTLETTSIIPECRENYRGLVLDDRCCPDGYTYEINADHPQKEGRCVRCIEKEPELEQVYIAPVTGFVNTYSDPTEEASTTWESLSSGGSSGSYVGNGRYGLDPQHMNSNGCFWINCRTGQIHFDSNLAGKTVTIQYVSDGVSMDDSEIVVHKFAEEALYKHIVHAILNTRANVDRNIVATFKKERSAAIRNAKIRLSSIKLEEITQILRGKSKWIKH